MIALVLLGVLLLWSLWKVVVLVRHDGLGTRPPPRSHAAETVGTTWPQHEETSR
jgi:hypothetical protein